VKKYKERKLDQEFEQRLKSIDLDDDSANTDTKDRAKETKKA
jgi:hypothetical protein